MLLAFRPTEIARGPRAVRFVLGQACEEFWLVRIAYLSTSGGGSELTIEPTDLDARHLYAVCFPDGDERRFVVDRIEWVRVLTEAEEALIS
jgi:predicted DNA-binding transcriptional regulator YafY